MCKRLLVLFIFVFVSAMMRIEAQQLNYQAIARNANGVALTFRDVGIRLSIRDGSQTGSIVYSETRNVKTNQFGLFTVVIGSPGASNVLGSMASINWISGNKYLQVEIDPEGGNNYFQAGTSQLQAVPYALFANAAYPVGPAGGDLLGSNYPNPIIAPLAVTTGKIADLNVTTAKLADQSVNNDKIQDNIIENVKLVNSKVTLNGLILKLGDVQDFAVGTAGTDVNIISAGKTHTFNFPTASATSRGVLSIADFNNFNIAYNSRISALTTTGSSGPATLTGNVLNIPNYTYSLPTATSSVLGGITTGANITNNNGNISINNNNVINALGTQTENLIFASPDGVNGLPGFRTLALGDIQDNLITNAKLANSSFNLGTTNIALGGTANTLTGLTSINSSNFIGPLTGNASTASAWANSRTISMTGDVTYTSNPFDGSGNTTGVATLANSGVTAGSYGSASTIPSFTVDAKGRINSATNIPLSGVSTLGSSLNSGNIIIGNTSNLAAAVPMSGDISISNTGVTAIGPLKVTEAMLFGGITDGKLATISTAGKVANSATTATNLNNPNTIVLRDALGDFSAGNITANLTGNASTVTNGVYTTDKLNVFSPTTSAELASIISDETGTGALAFATSPIFITPNLGVANATSINKLNISTPASAATLTIADGKTFTANNTLTFAGTDGTTMTFPTTNATIARTDASQTFDGTQIFNADILLNNIRIGRGAANNINNTAVGNNTLSNAVATGVGNSAFGAGALALINNGDDNTALGFGTLALNISGFNNTAVGQSALANTTGSSNTAVGQAAMQTNTTGINNTVMGKDALFTNLSGQSNTAIGHFAARLTTGSRNTALGQNSLKDNSNGEDNIAIGYQALSNTTGSNNIGIGSNTSIAATFGNSIVIGNSASVTAENAVVIGSGASNADGNSILLGGTSNALVKATGALTATGRITGTGARFSFRNHTDALIPITVNDYFIKITADENIIIPDATTMAGQKFVIFNGLGSNYNKFSLTGGQSIIGNGWPGLIFPNGSVSIFSDGANWLVESKN